MHARVCYIFLSVYLYVCLFCLYGLPVSLYLCLFASFNCLSVCQFLLFVCQFECLSVCLSVCVSVYLLLCLCVCLSVCKYAPCLLNISVSLSVILSVYLYSCLSVCFSQLNYLQTFIFTLLHFSTTKLFHSLYCTNFKRKLPKKLVFLSTNLRESVGAGECQKSLQRRTTLQCWHLLQISNQPFFLQIINSIHFIVLRRRIFIIQLTISSI